MRTFVDNAGRTWTVSITVNAVKRVRDLMKEDLLDVQTTLPRLLVDPILLCDLIYCICKPEADARGISDEDFGRAMFGDAIGHAKAAVLEELENFFPEPSRREALRLAIRKYQELEETVIETVKTHLTSPELPKELEIALRTAFDSSTKSPGSSASTPAP